MSTYDDVKRKAREMAVANTKSARLDLCGEIIAMVQGLEATRPASPEALAHAYEEGALKALELTQDVRREHEESFKTARYTAAGIVLNGLENYGQGILSKAESAVARHLNERRRKVTT